MDYWLDVKTTDRDGLNAAIEADARAAGAEYAMVSEDGISLRGELEESRYRGGELLSLLLTIPVGITIDVAADQIKRYFRDKGFFRGKGGIRKATIRWMEANVDPDGNVTTNERELQVEIDES